MPSIVSPSPTKLFRGAKLALQPPIWKRHQILHYRTRRLNCSSVNNKLLFRLYNFHIIVKQSETHSRIVSSANYKSYAPRPVSGESAPVRWANIELICLPYASNVLASNIWYKHWNICVLSVKSWRMLASMSNVGASVFVAWLGGGGRAAASRSRPSIFVSCVYACCGRCFLWKHWKSIPIACQI